MIKCWKGSTRVFNEKNEFSFFPFEFAPRGTQLFLAAEREESLRNLDIRFSATKQKRLVAKKRLAVRVLDTIEGKKFIGRKIGEVGGLG